MSEARIFVLVHAEARSRAVAAVRDAAEGMVVEVRPRTRSLASNALFHSLLGEIADTQEWAGKKRPIEVWKRLLVAAWLRARGESVEVLPALDGHGVDLVYTPTHTLSRAQMAELIDYVTAWMIEQGITA